MAIKFKIPIGWTVYKVTREEIFSWGGACICDYCNDVMTDDSYLIPVLNSCYCKKCFDEWEQTGKFYKEDLPVEARIINFYDKILKLED
jgi:hypothetical protein